MSDVTITISNNGPYVVEGPFSLTDHEGNVIPVREGAKVALCRCGGSTNKPFCDGTHSKTGFEGAIAAVEKASQ
jgi:CDGSH-type Zn-finger protein